MSLYGSLGSFSLDDILGLLGTIGQTGALAVTVAGATSRLYLEDGAVVAAEGEGGGDEPPLVTLVRLLRLDEGEFSFSPGATTAHPRTRLDIAGLVDAARERLDELRRIEVALPSPDHLVRLAPHTGTPEVTLSADQWRTLAVVAGGGRIGELLERLGSDELAALRSLKALVDAQLIEVAADEEDTPDDADGADGDDGDGDDGDGPGDEPGWDAGPEDAWGSGGQDERLVLFPRRAVRSWPAVDPRLAGTLDALAGQFDEIYESVRMADAAAEEEREAARASQGFLARLRHRPSP
ncbi:MAG: DUF4388 domain-containing protein [Acidimicrobiales bacterium]